MKRTIYLTITFIFFAISCLPAAPAAGSRIYRAPAPAATPTNTTTTTGSQQSSESSTDTAAKKTEISSPPIDAAALRNLFEMLKVSVSSTVLNELNKSGILTEEEKKALLSKVRAGKDIIKYLRPQLAAIEEASFDCSYQKIAMAVCSESLTNAKDDIDHGYANRAKASLAEIEKILPAIKKELDDISAGKLVPVEIPRYVTSPVTIERTSFFGKTRFPSGKEEIRPVFFSGYVYLGQEKDDYEKLASFLESYSIESDVDGNASSDIPQSRLKSNVSNEIQQVIQDVRRFPSLGLNMVQVDISPANVFSGDNIFSNQAITDFTAVAKTAANLNVQVNLLLSMQRLPDWMFVKYPHLKTCSGSAFRFCMFAPESIKLLEDYIRYVIPKVKDLPALHSVCLTNGPACSEGANCEFTVKMWRDFLKKTHGKIEKLNSNYGANYKSFNEVPVPDIDIKPDPVHYDWVVFNQQRLADWHNYYMKIIRELAPKLPVFSKIQMYSVVTDSNPFAVQDNIQSFLALGVNPELFAEISDINGNGNKKCIVKDGEYANDWIPMNLGCDLQFSAANKPLFNTENYIIDSQRPVPAAHVRNAIWQAAVHGQNATTLRRWEHGLDESISNSPLCAITAGNTTMDLMRFAKEIALLQKVKPSVTILYSQSSFIYSPKARESMLKLYEVLNFCGVKISFSTENQLARGKMPKSNILIVPAFTPNISDAAFKKLKSFVSSEGILVFMGEGLLSANEYNKPRTDFVEPSVKINPLLPKEKIMERLANLIKTSGVEKPVEVADASTNRPVWGVEYLSIREASRTIANITNYLSIPKTIKIFSKGNVAKIVNLMDGSQSDTLTLGPLEVALVEVK